MYRISLSVPDRHSQNSRLRTFFENKKIQGLGRHKFGGIEKSQNAQAIGHLRSLFYADEHKVTGPFFLR